MPMPVQGMIPASFLSNTPALQTSHSRTLCKQPLFDSVTFWPWEHLVKVMRTTQCVHQCFSVPALSLELSWSKSLRETQERTLGQYSLEYPDSSDSQILLQFLSAGHKKLSAYSRSDGADTEFPKVPDLRALFMKFRMLISFNNYSSFIWLLSHNMLYLETYIAKACRDRITDPSLDIINGRRGSLGYAYLNLKL